MPGLEWKFATNLDWCIDWSCNLCGIANFGDALCIREHLMGSISQAIGGKCKGVGIDAIATRLEDFSRKS